MKEAMKPILLIALGGNALIRKGQEGTVAQQFKNLAVPIRQIARLSRDYRIIITHGNGPQVGNLLLQQESCGQVPKLPLEILVAQTQGQIGYMIESTLDSELMDLGINVKPLISLITYVVVDENDPAYAQPSKPIGPAYKHKKDAPAGYPVIKTAKGFRRVVVSPKPVTIIEKREIKKLINADFIVICCGGGGIPVADIGQGVYRGVPAVVDKDYACSLLACQIGADLFIISTAVEKVALNFGKPDQEWLDTITLSQARQYLAEGKHFAKGSMAPKIQAVIWYLEGGGKRALITNPENISRAMRGETGTWIVNE